MADELTQRRGGAMPGPQGWPPYCCAILRSADGRFWLEQRAAGVRHAPGMLTCFGGRREEGEHPDDCIRRELREELGWTAAALQLSVRLMVEGTLVAWFYAGGAPALLSGIRPEPGLEIRLCGLEELEGVALSPWHRAAILAHLRGDTIAHARESP